MSDISLSELDLPFEASSVMNYRDHAVELVGDTLIVGYLADDSDCENPFESCDCNGRIYRKDGSRDDQRAMQNALGFNGDGEPDLKSAAIEEKAEAMLKEVVKRDFQGSLARFVIECVSKGKSTQQAWQAFVGDFQGGDECFLTEEVSDAGHSWDALRAKAWEACCADGSVGDIDAVPLDLYEHGQVAWHIGADLAKCDGVWLPDDYSRDEILRRAPVYRKGEIHNNNGTHGNLKHHVRTYRAHKSLPETLILDEDTVHPVFEQWGEAFEYLQNLEVGVMRSEAAGRDAAARDLAESACEQYTSWCNGDCYEIVEAVFKNIAQPGDEPEWEFESSEECWGFIGPDYAIEDITHR